MLVIRYFPRRNGLSYLIPSSSYHPQVASERRERSEFVSQNKLVSSDEYFISNIAIDVKIVFGYIL